jgi:hypothetical protein
MPRRPCGVKRKRKVGAGSGKASVEIARIRPVEHLDLAAVPSDDERTWQEVAASNRERIRALDHEMDRVRDALHEFRAEAQAIRYLAEKVGDLAGDVRALAQRVEQVSRHAVARPSATGLSVFAQYVAVIVALVALIVAVTR